MENYRDMYNKSVFIDDYFKKHSTDVENGSTLIPDLPGSAFTVKVTRTYGKVVLIILRIHTYGLDSKEFLNLKGTDEFLNELAGEKFEISSEGEALFMMLDKSFKLDLKKIKYGEDHRKILDSLKYFERY